MLTLGIDPGMTGAVAMLDAGGIIELLADLPCISSLSLKWIDGAALQSLLLEAIADRPCRAVIERVSAMPRQGLASSFQFGVGFGSILGVLQTLQLPIELITPAVWKRGVGVTADKKSSLHAARLRFPTADLKLAKHDGRAEALLLATYAQSRRPA